MIKNQIIFIKKTFNFIASNWIAILIQKYIHLDTKKVCIASSNYGLQKILVPYVSFLSYIEYCLQVDETKFVNLMYEVADILAIGVIDIVADCKVEPDEFKDILLWNCLVDSIFSPIFSNFSIINSNLHNEYSIPLSTYPTLREYYDPSVLFETYLNLCASCKMQWLPVKASGCLLYLAMKKKFTLPLEYYTLIEEDIQLSIRIRETKKQFLIHAKFFYCMDPTSEDELIMLADTFKSYSFILFVNTFFCAAKIHQLIPKGIKNFNDSLRNKIVYLISRLNAKTIQ